MMTRALIPIVAGTLALLAGPMTGAVRGQPDAPAPQTPAAQPEPAPKPAEPRAERGDDPGTEIVIYLKDGKSLTGLLLRENKDELTIRISGIETPIATSRIDRYQILPPILERYRQYRESIGEDPDQILTLVRWLQARERFELALIELERVFKLDPNSKEALALKNVLESQIELRDSARSGREAKGPAPAATGPVEVERSPAREVFPLLSDAQVGLIKVYEVDFNHPPRLVIPRETIARMLEKYQGNALLPVTQEGRDGIYRKPALDVLDLMFRLRAREFYSEVQVLDQPRSMRLFRDDVQAGWLINSCATTACHGGDEAGRLMLINRKPRAEAAVYTNFIILDRFRLSDGTALINYDDPEKSPLLQMGLPRGDALFQHPVVPRGARGHDVWKPTFRNPQENSFERTVDWIKAMYRPRPEYPIEYQPPGASEAPKVEKKEPAPR